MKKLTQYALPRELSDAIKIAAIREGCSASKLVTGVLQRYVDENLRPGMVANTGKQRAHG